LPDSRLRHAFYKLYARVDVDLPSRSREEILRVANGAGLRVFAGSCSEVYLEQAFADLPIPDLPNARSLTSRSLMVEVHPTLQPDLLQKRAAVLAKIARNVLDGKRSS
jgi:dTDP-4-amino-4,6-dideoxygalactose transaminase